MCGNMYFYVLRNGSLGDWINKKMKGSQNTLCVIYFKVIASSTRSRTKQSTYSRNQVSKQDNLYYTNEVNMIIFTDAACSVSSFDTTPRVFVFACSIFLPVIPLMFTFLFQLHILLTPQQFHSQNIKVILNII